MCIPGFLCLLDAHQKKDFIMSNVKHLKEECNEDGIKYFIVNQMSDAANEQYRQTNELIKEVKKKFKEHLRSNSSTTE